MNNPVSQIQHTLGYLSDQLVIGWSNYLVAKNLHQAYSDRRITSARYFFATTYLSCVESAILALSRMGLAHGDSITIEYLLNCSENNSRVFPRADQESVLQAVSEHRQRLDNLSTLVENIRTQRDQTIAHLDRRYVNNPSAIYSSPPIDMEQVEDAFRLLLRIINTFRGYMDSSELSLANLDPGVADDLEYIVGLIEKASEET